MSSRAFTGIVGAEASRDLVTARAELRRVPQDVQQKIGLASSEQLSEAWGQELALQPGYDGAQRKLVTENARVVAHSSGLSAYTGGELARQFEFGALNRDTFKTYLGRRGTKTFEVRRRTKRQMPSRSQTGWIAYPAAAKVADRAARLWQQLIVKAVHDALERGR